MVYGRKCIYISTMELYGTIRNYMELYGTIWNYMELYGTIWNLVSTIDIPVYMELIWTIYGTYKCRS